MACSVRSLEVGLCSANKERFLDRHLFESGNWKKKVAQKHPTSKLTLSVDPSNYEGFGLDFTLKIEECQVDDNY